MACFGSVGGGESGTGRGDNTHTRVMGREVGIITRMLRTRWAIGLLATLVIADVYCVYSRNDSLSYGDREKFYSWITMAFRPAYGYTGPGHRGECKVFVSKQADGTYEAYPEDQYEHFS